MNCYGGGFLNLINYGISIEADIEESTIVTENNFDLLTEDGSSILIES